MHEFTVVCQEQYVTLHKKTSLYFCVLIIQTCKLVNRQIQMMWSDDDVGRILEFGVKVICKSYFLIYFFNILHSIPTFFGNGVVHWQTSKSAECLGQNKVLTCSGGTEHSEILLSPHLLIWTINIREILPNISHCAVL